MACLIEKHLQIPAVCGFGGELSRAYCNPPAGPGCYGSLRVPEAEPASSANACKGQSWSPAQAIAANSTKRGSAEKPETNGLRDALKSFRWRCGAKPLPTASH